MGAPDPLADGLLRWRVVRLERIPAALRFESAEGNHLRFSPLPGFHPRDAARPGMLTAVAGGLWLDSSTYEITRLEYDLVRDPDEPGKPSARKTPATP